MIADNNQSNSCQDLLASGDLWPGASNSFLLQAPVTAIVVLVLTFAFITAGFQKLYSSHPKTRARYLSASTEKQKSIALCSTSTLWRVAIGAAGWKVIWATAFVRDTTMCDEDHTTRITTVLLLLLAHFVGDIVFREGRMSNLTMAHHMFGSIAILRMLESIGPAEHNSFIVMLGFMGVYMSVDIYGYAYLVVRFFLPFEHKLYLPMSECLFYVASVSLAMKVTILGALTAHFGPDLTGLDAVIIGMSAPTFCADHLHVACVFYKMWQKTKREKEETAAVSMLDPVKQLEEPLVVRS